jgi:lipopolysaccharide transport system permease protein
MEAVHAEGGLVPIPALPRADPRARPRRPRREREARHERLHATVGVGCKPRPRHLLPVGAIASNIPQFLVGLLPLVLMMLVFFRGRLSPFLVLIPVVAAVQLVFTLAIGILLAAFGVFARDTWRLTGHVLRLWFFLSPGIYSVDRIEHAAARYPAIGLFFRLNPFTTLFEAYRDLVYRARCPDLAALAWLLIASLALLAIALIVFKRLEPAFAKVL